MQIHQLQPVHRLKRRKRVGRGGKRGTYSGRGIKGQRARAGRKLKDVQRELILRLPKLRGIKFKVQQVKAVVLNLREVERVFDSGSKISPKTLWEKGLVEKEGGALPPIKILGGVKIKKKLHFAGVNVSQSVKEEIERAGGKID